MENANYAQKTYSANFSLDGQQIYSNLVGDEIRTVSDLSNALIEGKITPKQLPIDYINRDGNILILNTRTSQALTQAGIPRSQWYISDRTGVSFYESQLNAQLNRNKLSSDGISAVRQGGGK